jgi:hypothetical protein
MIKLYARRKEFAFTTGRFPANVYIIKDHQLTVETEDEAVVLTTEHASRFSRKPFPAIELIDSTYTPSYAPATDYENNASDVTIVGEIIPADASTATPAPAKNRTKQEG